MVYDDQNTNCAQNPNELPLVGQLVRVDPGPLYATVDPTGTYNVPVPAGNWTVTHLIPNSNLYTPVSPTPYSYQVNGVSGGQTVNNLDFAVESQYTCHEPLWTLAHLFCAGAILRFTRYSIAISGMIPREMPALISLSTPISLLKPRAFPG